MDVIGLDASVIEDRHQLRSRKLLAAFPEGRAGVSPFYFGGIAIRTAPTHPAGEPTAIPPGEVSVSR